ncbi:MAG: L,D-transpeptidase family protein [Lachnospiraceae bacterium]|nr:L,D-transpeptidase family protein [Lachnospiraceae bacterium]
MGMLIGMAALFAVFSYVSIGSATSYRFLPRTTVNGTDVSGMTLEEAAAALDEADGGYELTVQFRESEETIAAEEIGLTYDMSAGEGIEVLRDVYPEIHDPLMWLPDLLFGKHVTVSLPVSYKAHDLLDLIHSWSETDRNAMRAPRDAQVMAEDGAFVIAEADDGTTLNVRGLIANIVQALKAQERVLTTENLYESAEMTSAAPSLQRDLSSLNHILEEPVTVTYDLPGDRTEVLDMTVMRGWLRHNDALGGFTYDEELWEESLREYVAGLADEVDTVGTDFTFRMTGGGEFTETSYNYGWQIDQRAEIAQLEEDLSSGRDVEREPVYAVRAYVDEGIGDTYIEVDLSRQHLWVYEDGHVVKQSDVMSGRLTPQRFTPAGVYRVYFIQRNRTLRGEIQPDGQPEYMTPVSYWMEFRRTFGLHDNYWRNQSMFGDTYYIYGGSHGCINLPVAFAAELYPWVEEHGEVPVLVYYSQGDPF